MYLVDQGQFSEASPDELKAMDVKVEDLEGRCKQNQNELKEAQSQLKLVNSSITTEEARDLVQKVMFLNIIFQCISLAEIRSSNINICCELYS